MVKAVVNKRKKLTKEQLEQRVLYFAYGSNMHQPRLEQRVGKVTYVATYVLPDYKLTFDTGNTYCSYANVKECAKETCEGVIYEMTYKQLLILDRFELLYERRKVMYGERRLHFYVSDYWRNERQIPRLTMEYYALLMLGCAEHNLNQSYNLIQNFRPKVGSEIRGLDTFYAVEQDW